jgi:hypothetical protein
VRVGDAGETVNTGSIDDSDDIDESVSSEIWIGSRWSENRHGMLYRG